MEEKGSMMNRTIKAAVGMVAIAAMSVGTLAACGGSRSSSDNGKGKVYFLNFKPESNDEWQKLAKDYTKETGVEVKVQTAASGTYEQTLKSEIAKSEAPTLFQVNGPVGYQNWSSYTEDMSDTEPYKQLINKDVALKDGDKAVGVPYAMETYGLIYNKDLFDQAGVAYPTNDWTQDDVQAAAEAIRALGDDIYGIWQPITYNEFFKVVAQYGGALLNADKTQFTINSPENLKAAQTLVDRVLVSNVQPNAAQQGGMGDWDMFMSGRLGMIPTGIWAFATFTEGCDFAWDIAVEPGSTQKATHFFSNCVVMNPDTKYPEAVATWLAWLTSSTESADIRLAAGWDLPALKDLNALSSYLEITPPDNRKAVFESLDYLVMPPVIEDYALMSDIITQKLAAAAEGTITVQEALDQAQAECEAQITLG